MSLNYFKLLSMRLLKTGVIFILFCSHYACENDPRMKNIVIIGGGLMGSAAAWELANSDQEVLLLEQQDSIYSYGSSFGEARISRSLGPEEDLFSYLQQRSIVQTQQLIDYLNKDANELHSMDDIYTTSPVTYVHYPVPSKEAEIFNLNDLDTIARTSTDKIIYALDQREAKEKFGMQIPDSLKVVREFRQYSGTLNPKMLIKKLHTGITKSGNTILYNRQVISLKNKDTGYEIVIKNSKTGQEEIIRAKKIVAAAGPYNGELLKDLAPYVDQLITPKRLFLSFLKIKPAAFHQLSEIQRKKLYDFHPGIKLNQEIFYTMIEKTDEDGAPILKVGGHFLRTPIQHLNEVWKQELSNEEISWSIRNSSNYLQMLDLPLDESDLEFHSGYSCVYSLTESEVPYVTNILTESGDVDANCILIGGMSGVGAKGTLTYGRLAADLLLGQDESSYLYQKTKSALGIDRLKKDIDQYLH